jgi:amidase
MTGVDKRDTATQSHKKRKLKDYTSFLDQDGLKGARIGVARSLAGANPRILEIFEKNLAVLASLGAEIVDPADLPKRSEFLEDELEVLLTEYKAALKDYFAELSGEVKVRKVKDVIRFNEANKDKVMPFHGQERFLTAQEKGSLKASAMKSAMTCACTSSRISESPINRYSRSSVSSGSVCSTWGGTVVSGTVSG